jgi:hypothetical protein
LPPRCCSVQLLASPTSPTVLRPEAFCMVAGTPSILKSSSSVLKRNLVHAHPSSDARLGNSSSESRIARCGFSWKLERRKTLKKSRASTPAMSTCRCDAMLPAINVGQMATLPPMCSRVFFHSSALDAVTHEPAMPHLAHYSTLFQSVPSSCLGADLCIDTPCSAIPISVRQTR